MIRAAALPALLLPLLFAAPALADDFEGDDPGECSDGADNDRDGKFDCDDEDCAGSPDCADDDDPGLPPWLDEEEGVGDVGDGDVGDAGVAGAAEPDPEPMRGATPPPASSTSSSDLDATDLRSLKGGGPFGIGFAVGTINGLSIKIWPARAHGIVLHLGTHPAVLNTLIVDLQYRIHVPALVIPDSPVSMHFNLGPAFRTRLVWFSNGTYIEMAGGLALGTSITVAKVPAEVFFEVIPSFGGGVSPAGGGIGFSVDGVVGARFYVGK